MSIQDGIRFIREECIAPWRDNESLREGETLADLVRPRTHLFGPRLRRAGFELTAAEIEAVTTAVMAEIDPTWSPSSRAPEAVEVPPMSSAEQYVANIEQAIVAQWQADRDLQAEFGGDLARFAAFKRNESRINLRKGRTPGPEHRAIAQSEEEDRAAGVDPKLSVEDRARIVWDANEDVRNEFLEKEAYVAWRKHAERSAARH